MRLSSYIHVEALSTRCDVGQKLNESCDLAAEPEFYLISKEEIEILELQTKCHTFIKICKGHRKIFLTLGVNHQGACCDSLLRHHGKKPVKARSV